MTIIIPKDQADFDATLRRLMEADHHDKRISLVTDTPYTSFDVPLSLAVAAGFLPEQTAENTTPPAPATEDDGDQDPAEDPADDGQDDPRNAPPVVAVDANPTQPFDAIPQPAEPAPADKTTDAPARAGKPTAPAQGAKRKEVV